MVGDLQPILAEVGEATRRLAMLPKSERERQLEREIAALRQRLQNREAEVLQLDEFLSPDAYHTSPTPPVTLADLESLLTTSQATGRLFQSHPEIERAYLLDWKGARLPVTFSRECFDEHPDTVRFLSYGSPLLSELLQPVPQPSSDPTGALIRCRASKDVEVRGWYAVVGNRARPQLIETLLELRAWLMGNHEPAATSGESLIAEAQALFAEEVTRIRQRQAQVLKHRRTAHYLAERAKAQQILIKAALVEIVLGQQRDLFETEVYPSAFNEEAVRGLQRHGFPWGPLLKLAFEPDLSPREDDAYYQQIAGDRRESLKARFAQLREEAKKTVQVLSAATEASQRESPEGVEAEAQRIEILQFDRGP